MVVWDLKSNKSIFTFTEPSSNASLAGAGGSDNYFDYFSGSDQDQQHQKVPSEVKKETVLVWNPEIPTQFLIANDDDQNPSFNIWDLRNPDYPVATF